MKERLGIPLEIDYADINGVAQVDTANDKLNGGMAFDVMIVANAPFLCSDAAYVGTAIRNLYEFVVPIHREYQHVLRTKLKDQGKFPGLKGIEKLSYLGESSCEEQYRGISELSGTSVKGVAWGISDLPSLLDGLEGDEAVIIYDPAASRLVRLGTFVSIPTLDYNLWVSMFVLAETLERFAIREALLNAFIASWVFCKAHRNYAWNLLMRDTHIMPAFQYALFRRGNGYERFVPGSRASWAKSSMLSLATSNRSLSVDGLTSSTCSDTVARCRCHPIVSGRCSSLPFHRDPFVPAWTRYSEI